MISDEAVEAAAIANYEARTGKQWSDAPNGEQAIERSWMRRTLEAAAPYMLADAWDAGGEAAIEREHTYGAEEKAKFSNPYRSARG